MKIGFSCGCGPAPTPPDGRPSEGHGRRSGRETVGHSLGRTCAEPPEDVALSFQLVELERQIPTAHLAALPQKPEGGGGRRSTTCRRGPKKGGRASAIALAKGSRMLPASSMTLPSGGMCAEVRALTIPFLTSSAMSSNGEPSFCCHQKRCHYQECQDA